VDFNARMVQAITAAMLVLLVAYDNNYGQPEYAHLVLEAFVPLAVIVLVWHENPRRYGLALGDWRLGLPVAIAGIAIMAVAIAILGQLPDFRIYYTVLAAQRPAWRLILDAGVDMFAWEFFFRGWLLGAFRPRYGTDAIWLQMISCTSGSPNWRSSRRSSVASSSASWPGAPDRSSGAGCSTGSWSRGSSWSRPATSEWRGDRSGVARAVFALA
jgi:hypothetical protein